MSPAPAAPACPGPWQLSALKKSRIFVLPSEPLYLADALRKAIHEAIYPMVGQAGAVLSPYFVQSTPVGRALVAWEHAEAEADCDAYLAEFDQRLAASGQSWGIWDKYSFHVRFMLSGFDISDRLTVGFKAQLERAAAYIEQRRVPQ